MVNRFCTALVVAAMYSSEGWAQSVEHEMRKVQRQLSEVEQQWTEYEKKKSDSEDRRREAERKWTECSVRRGRGVRMMDRYVVDLERLRRSAEDYRSSAEVRRTKVEQARVRLEARRQRLEDDELMLDYVAPMIEIILEYRNVCDIYAKYLDAMNVYGATYTGAADRCDNRKSVMSALGAGLSTMTPILGILSPVGPPGTIIQQLARD